MIDSTGIERCGICMKPKKECYENVLIFKKYHGIGCMDFEGECCLNCICEIEESDKE